MSLRSVILPVVTTLLLTLPGFPAAAQEVQRLTINQAVQTASQPPQVRVYLDLLDSSGKALEAASAENFTASLGGRQALVSELTPFAETEEGVAYVFLVDISRSLDTATFGRIRSALEEWIGALGPRDRAAILAFGEDSRLVVDFTEDAQALREGLATLGPTDDLTVLHRGLRDALELGLRRDADLPLRRALVVLTDGRDEGSGLALDDVLQQLRDNPLPIYAIGYSRLREPLRTEFLEVLRRLAENSGGAFFASDETDFSEAYGAIREAVGRVWVTDLTCTQCSADGSVSRLQLDLAQGSRVLSRGMDLRLLPGRGEAANVPETTMPADGVSTDGDDAGTAAAGRDTGDGAGTSPAEPSEGAKDGGGDQPPWWVWAIAGVLVLAVMAVLLGRRKPKAREGSEIPLPIDLEDVDTGEVAPVLEPLPVRLVVVRGSRKGKEYRLTLREQATVGKRSTCDCILTDEENVAPVQFELFQRSGAVWIRERSEAGTTRLGGRPLEEERSVRTGDLVGTQETILRIVLDKAE
ncbi:MAG: VWA domain-containing protein [Acidobacteriota bacterium]|nr:VWA domain-containing protein [Acidobacteriota bacterium]